MSYCVFFFFQRLHFNSLMSAINLKNCQRKELRSICPDVFNCRDGVKNPLAELKVNGPGGYIRTAKPSDSVIIYHTAFAFLLLSCQKWPKP